MNSERRGAPRKEMLQATVSPVGADEGERLLEIWETSVRATHSFLSESDIQSLKPLVLEKLFCLEHLVGVRDLTGRVVGFLGVDGANIEALFVDPSWHRMGVGRRLADHAESELGATAVDVNEQNGQAVAFYLHLGFRIEGRSEVDSMGKPFPLLHLRRCSESKGRR